MGVKTQEYIQTEWMVLVLDQTIQRMIQADLICMKIPKPTLKKFDSIQVNFTGKEPETLQTMADAVMLLVNNSLCKNHLDLTFLYSLRETHTRNHRKSAWTD